jgi:hypothetical protein
MDVAQGRGLASALGNTTLYSMQEEICQKKACSIEKINLGYKTGTFIFYQTVKMKSKALENTILTTLS